VKTACLQAKPDTTPVKEVMLKTPIAITPEKSLQEAIRLMREKRVDTLLVTDDSNALERLHRCRINRP
jgi:osmoprotectant transport system ATP-binding protein